MSTENRDHAINRLLETARKLEADEARIIDVKDIVLDERVRLKCLVPICSSYGKNLMCPPNVMSVHMFARILGLYSRALIVQVEADSDSTDKSSDGLTQKTCEELEDLTKARDWQVKLHKIINRLEAAAFKEGFHLAAGLTGGDCSLCSECVTTEEGKHCRHPFEARPSMEAMGIDVLRTCENVGLPLHLSSDRKVRWTGLVLLE